jgi:hypothetical protein
MKEGSDPMTRLRTLEAALCWRKRVVSLAPIENPCQLIIAPGLLVMLSELPSVEKLACPATTVGSVPFARAWPTAKTNTIAAVTAICRLKTETWSPLAVIIDATRARRLNRRMQRTIAKPVRNIIKLMNITMIVSSGVMVFSFQA